MKLVLVLLSLSLTGCFYQTVDSYDIDLAIDECQGVENIAEIVASFEGSERVLCKKQLSKSLIGGLK